MRGIQVGAFSPPGGIPPPGDAPMPLTDLVCRNARCPEGKPYVRLADGEGLYLEVTAAGVLRRA